MKVNFIKNLKPENGKKNMEIDLNLLEEAIKTNSGDLTVRFYTWYPKCLSFGRNQKEIHPQTEIDTVKRPTGGRALLHDKELTYSVIAPVQRNQSILQSYKEISDALIEGFKKLGIELEYSNHKEKKSQYCMNISCGADVSYNGKKLIGSAQFRKKEYLLQHGSILFDVDYDYLEKIFLEKADKNSIITLKEINPDITMETLVEALIYGFKTKFEHKTCV